MGREGKWKVSSPCYCLSTFLVFLSFVFLSLSSLITMWTPWGGIKTDNTAGRELWRHGRSCEKRGETFTISLHNITQFRTMHFINIINFIRFLPLRIKSLFYTHLYRHVLIRHRDQWCTLTLWSHTLIVVFRFHAYFIIPSHWYDKM